MQVLVTCLFAAMFLQGAHAVAGIAGASVLGLVFLIVGGVFDFPFTRTSLIIRTRAAEATPRIL